MKNSDRAVRSVDVAAHAGVSRTTVSYVLNGRTDVSIPEATRRRVLKVAAELGYKPNGAARALVTGSTRLISLLMVGTTIRHQADVMQSLQAKLSPDQYELIINRFSSIRPHAPEGNAMTNWHVDGTITYNANSSTSLQVNASSPLVSMGCYYSDRGDYVGVDLKSGMSQAVHHLVSTGRRKIAYLVSQWGNRAGDSRLEGYAETMRHYGLEPRFIIAEDGTKPFAKQAVEAHLAHQLDFDALTCFSDEMALGAYKALVDFGVQLPEDVSLVGCDGIDELEYVDTPISTIVQPIDQMCLLAWSFLKNRMNEPTLPLQQVVLQAPLLVRASSSL